MNEQQLLEQLEGLPSEREPGRNLWPGILQRIAPAGLSGLQHKPWFNAVAATLVMGLSLTLGIKLGIDTRSDPGISANHALTVAPIQTSEGRFYAGLLDLEYAGALRDVAGQFRADPQIAPDQEDVALTQSLKILQRATEDLRGALEKDPGSIFLADLLASTHRKRMNLLRDLALAQVYTIKLNLRRT